MRKILTYILLAGLVVTAQSCDFVRTLAHRPTSDVLEKYAIIDSERIEREERAEIERLEQEALQMEAAIREQQLRDSLETAIREEQVRDSLQAALDLGARGIRFYNRTETPALRESTLEDRYYIVTGVFGTPANIARAIGAAAADGCTAVALPSDTPVKVLSVASAATLPEIRDALDTLSRKGFFPKDAWILVND